MKRFLYYSVIVFLTGLVAGASYYVCTQLDDTRRELVFNRQTLVVLQKGLADAEARNAEVFRIALERGDKVESENAASIADRKRIVEALDRLESHARDPHR